MAGEARPSYALMCISVDLHLTRKPPQDDPYLLLGGELAPGDPSHPVLDCLGDGDHPLIEHEAAWTG